ncbi:MAG TPA: hypothetical protein VIK86_07765 [Candidatus Paceibacterota bacterium]
MKTVNVGDKVIYQGSECTVIEKWGEANISPSNNLLLRDEELGINFDIHENQLDEEIISKRMTNFEVFTQDVEWLANFLRLHFECNSCPAENSNCDTVCLTNMINWLNEPTEVEYDIVDTK